MGGPGALGHQAPSSGRLLASSGILNIVVATLGLLPICTLSLWALSALTICVPTTNLRSSTGKSQNLLVPSLGHPQGMREVKG